MIAIERKINTYLQCDNKKQIFMEWILRLGVLNWMPDKIYLKILYRIRTGKKLNLNPPIMLNEKMQWMKLYDRNPVYTTMVDKYKAKRYMATKLGTELYIIPTIGVWDSASDIDFNNLPDQFVLKCNHTSSHGLFICKDKSNLNVEYVRKQMKQAMKFNYYKQGREWPYKNVKRKIICEKYLENSDGSPLVDYKFFCYGGEPRYFMYSLGEADGHVKNHKFNMKLESIDYLFKKTPALADEDIRLPVNINEMIKIVRVLCVGFRFIRIDMFNIDGRIYLGEMTFFPSSGFINILSEEYSQKMADYIELSPL